MKKLLFSIALAAVIGAVSYFSMLEKAEEFGLNSIELANVEALGFDEVEPTITCNYPTKGLCWEVDILDHMRMCGEAMFYPCKFVGKQDKHCTEPCIY